jgi:peptidoglycan L-alanyl-D-glutamate endopeptidase CwlK
MINDKKFQEISLERLNTLNPKISNSAITIITDLWKERVPIYVLWGSRTIEEQNMMYRFGRTLPGDILTTKRGGFSPHNYGLAFDFCFITGGKMVGWDVVHSIPYQRARWIRTIGRFQAEGWESGFRWPSFEPGHMQKMLGYSIGDLHQLYEQESQNRYNRI